MDATWIEYKEVSTTMTYRMQWIQTTSVSLGLSGMYIQKEVQTKMNFEHDGP